MASMAAIELTDEQRRAAHEADRHVRITGGAGTGKTTALLGRYRSLLDRVPASSILVLCRSREAAARFLDAVLPHLAGGFDYLPVTTVHGLAFDLVSRHAGPVELLSGPEQREQVAQLLAADTGAHWPTLHHLLHRRPFARQVAAAVLDLQTSLLADDEVRARGEAAGVGSRWAELTAFASRYRAGLAGAGRIDHAGLVATAVALLRRPEVEDLEQGRFAHVLVDDYHAATPATDGLVGELARLGAVVTVAGDPEGAHCGPHAGGLEDPVFLVTFPARFDALDVGLSGSFRRPHPPTLVPCTHPAVEPEAVVGILLDARDRGVAWRDMAVLVRGQGERARGIARALARHGVPVAPLGGSAGAEPTVGAVVDMLRWVGGDAGAVDRILASPVAGLDPSEVRTVRRESAAGDFPVEDHPRLAPLDQLRHELEARVATATPADLAFEIWARTLGHLVDDDDADRAGPAGDRALDALVSFVEGLRRRAERHPDERLADFLAVAGGGGVEPVPWRSAAAPSPEVVTVASIDGAAGREWHTVVVAGCVEGELPSVRVRHGLFDRQLLRRSVRPGARTTAAGGAPTSSLDHERRLFAAACSRATGELVATAAPEPGVLLSRFVEGWPSREPDLPLAPGPELVALAPTPGTGPVSPDGSLRLSASRLATYDDCPLRYCYEYVLGARGDAGVRADLGSLVHEVLAAFLDPHQASGVPHTLEGLLALGEQRWRDDIAPYRPQVEEARRDFFAMLQGWWEAEGSQGDLAPDVVSVERRFEVDVGPHRLSGAIDRIDRAGDGHGIRIVDYKTGKAEPTAEEVATDIQLAIYHLAAVRDPELAALGPPTELRLLYLRKMHVFTQEIGPDHEQVTRERVLERAARIGDEQFQPSVDANCRTCSFQRLCPLHDEGRQLA